MAEKFGDDGVRFISVTDEPEEKITAFLKRKPINTWAGLDKDDALDQAFNITGLPTTVVINPDGKYAGKISLQQLDEAMIQRIENGELLEKESSGFSVSGGQDPFETDANPPLIQFTLRESKPASPTMSASSGKGRTILGHSPKNIIYQVFGLRGSRSEFEAELPDKRFDLITQHPTRSPDDFRQFVKDSILDAFGIAIKQETRNSDVFVLHPTKEENSKLEPTASTGGSSSSSNQTKLSAVNCSVSNMLMMMESKLGRPVLDESSLTGKYDFSIEWEKDAAPEEIAKSIADSTGLELKQEKRDVLFTIVHSND